MDNNLTDGWSEWVDGWRYKYEGLGEDRKVIWEHEPPKPSPVPLKKFWVHFPDGTKSYIWCSDANEAIGHFTSEMLSWALKPKDVTVEEDTGDKAQMPEEF